MLPSVAATISNDEKNLIEMASLCGLNRLYLKLRPYDGLKLFVRSRATAHAGTISKKFNVKFFVTFILAQCVFPNGKVDHK